MYFVKVKTWVLLVTCTSPPLIYSMWLNIIICIYELHVQSRKEAQHENPGALALGTKTTEKSETYFHCGPPCMWVYMCVCGCWLWSVRQAWKNYRSGNNFTVCMGNCCDLFRWTVQILSREGDGLGTSERVMTTNGEVTRRGIKMLGQKINRH